MKKLYFVMALLIVASMVLTACGTPATPAPAATAAPATKAPAATQAPAAAATATEAPTKAAAFKVGEVSDFGGVDDKSFNQLAWDGVQKATRSLHRRYQHRHNYGKQQNRQKNIASAGLHRHSRQQGTHCHIPLCAKHNDQEQARQQ